MDWHLLAFRSSADRDSGGNRVAGPAYGRQQATAVYRLCRGLNASVKMTWRREVPASGGTGRVLRSRRMCSARRPTLSIDSWRTAPIPAVNARVRRGSSCAPANAITGDARPPERWGPRAPQRTAVPPPSPGPAPPGGSAAADATGSAPTSVVDLRGHDLEQHHFVALDLPAAIFPGAQRRRAHEGGDPAKEFGELSANAVEQRALERHAGVVVEGQEQLDKMHGGRSAPGRVRTIARATCRWRLGALPTPCATLSAPWSAGPAVDCDRRPGRAGRSVEGPSACPG